MLHVSLGWEVKIDMSGQSNVCLRVCNVKMKKCLLRWKQGTFLRISRLRPVASSNLNSFKKLKLDKKESPEPKISDFECFGEVFNFNMSNMFSWLYHSLLISEGNSCLILMFDHSFQSLGPALPLEASKTPKMAKTCPKNCQHWQFLDTP